MSAAIDNAQRREALDPNKSLAVTAPAGSGKTELLTRRVLTLLAGVEQPEQILAITFTRKAANEMRHRILAALQMARQDAPEDAYQKELWGIARRALARDTDKGWQLLENPNRLRLQTIDSFCMSLVRHMPILSGIGGDLGICDKPEFLYKEAIRRLFEQLKTGGPALTDLKQLVSHLDNNLVRVESLLSDILGKREQWLRYLVGHGSDLNYFKEQLESHLECLITETLANLHDQLEHANPALLQTLQFASLNLPIDKRPFDPDATALPDYSSAQLSTWKKISNLLLTRSGTWRVKLTKNEGFPVAPNSREKTVYREAKESALALIEKFSTQDDLRLLLVEINSLPHPLYDEGQWRLLGCLSRLLPQLVAELILVFGEAGEVDHQQITIAAHAALGHSEVPSDISLLLDHRLHHILVDEFQDTSSTQFQLLSRLTESWQPDDGKSFFIVGDGMQSCYGFRDANVGLFLAARQFGIGNVKLHSLELEVNFRSQQGVVDWVNGCFSQAFPDKDDISRGAVSYTGCTAFKEQSDTNPVVFYVCEEDTERTVEADQVVQLVQQYKDEAPQESIAILVRNRSHLSAITQRLTEASIHWSGVDLEPLTDKPAIQDLLALTRAALNPVDRVAWLSILRAPWCGLTLKDLELIADLENSRQPVWLAINDDNITQGLSSAGFQVLRRLQVIFTTAFAQRARKPLRQWIEGLWLALAGPATVSSIHELKQISIYFELLEKHQKNGLTLDIEQFCQAVDEIYAQPEEQADAVQIMTIHKAKGLEFDRVIIPGMDRGGRSQGNELMLQHERLSNQGCVHLMISPITASGGEQDSLYEYIKQEQKQKVRLENTRLTYVAATRAIKRLALIACLKRNPETNRLVAPPGASLLHCLWPVIEDQAIYIKPEALQKQVLTANQQGTEFSLLRFDEDWVSPTLPKGDILHAYRGHEYGDQPENTVISESDVLLEKAVRQLFYAIEQTGIEQWINRHQDNFPVILSRMDGFQHNPEFRGKLLAILNSAKSDPQGSWLLSGNHQGYLSNREMLFRIANHSVTLRLPHCFVTDRQRWVVDVSLADDIELYVNQHQTQMTRFREGLAQIDNLPVKTACYFPLRQQLQSL